MKVKIDKSFEKDTDKIKDRKLLVKVAKCIEHVAAANSLIQINNLKKLSGFDNYYRIKIGDYRLGIFIRANEARFERFLHRKDIYRYYP